MAFIENVSVQATSQMLALLEASKQKIETILTSLPDIFAIVDIDGNLYKWNAVASKLIGEQHQSLRNKNFSTLFTDQGWDIFKDTLETCRQANSPDFAMEVEIPIFSDSGRERNIFWSILQFASDSGSKPTLFRIFGRDISLSLILSRKNQQLQMERNRLDLILNASAQGFFTLSENLEIEPGYSSRAETLLGNDLGGKSISKILNLNQDTVHKIKEILTLTRADESAPKPTTFETSINSRMVRLEFSPIFSHTKVFNILGSVVDVTPLKLLEQKAKKAEQMGKVVLKVMEYRQIFSEAVRPYVTDGYIDYLAMNQAAALIYIHNVKAEFAFFGFSDAVAACDLWEEKLKDKFTREEFNQYFNDLRGIFRDFMNTYGSVLELKRGRESTLPISFSRLSKFVQKAHASHMSPELFQLLEEALENRIDITLKWLNDTWMATAANQKKTVSPITWLKTVHCLEDPYKELFTTLIHLVRNSISHGIETPDEREAAKKNPRGRLFAEATLGEDGFYRLRFWDDGRGLDSKKILEKAHAAKIAAPPLGTELSNTQYTDILCHPKFSTATVDPKDHEALSGKGIGLSAIRQEAKNLNGDVLISRHQDGGFEICVTFERRPITLVFRE